MAKRIGFDDGAGEDVQPAKVIFRTIIWSLKSIFVRAFDFSGRTRLPVYWIEFGSLVGINVGAVMLLLEPGQEPPDTPVTAIIYFASLYLILPIITRRAHDLNISGWSVLNIFSPLITGARFLSLFFRPGSAAANDYGERINMGLNARRKDPKQIG